MEVLLIVNSILLWALVLFNLLLTLALIRRLNAKSDAGHEAEERDQLKPGEQAPAFQAQDINGQTVSLASYTGRKTLFLFVAPDCGPCRSNMSYYLSLGPSAARAGTDVVFVSDATVERNREFAQEFEISLPVLTAPYDENTFFQDYKADGTPSYCLIDENGRVVNSGYPSSNLKVAETGWKAAVESWNVGKPAPKSFFVTAGNGR
jgi:peroxiredoxin